MKLFVGLAMIVGAYAYFLMYVTDAVTQQTAHINNTYQYVANNSDKIVNNQ